MRQGIFVFLTCWIISCFAVQTLLVTEKYIYEMYRPPDEIPSESFLEVKSMLFDSYAFDRFYAEVPVEEMHLGPQFSSYKAYMIDHFDHEFIDYQHPGERFFLQARTKNEGKVVGICVVVAEPDHNYYVDHVAVDGDFRRQGIGTQLLSLVQEVLPDFHELSLDTRVFNLPAHALYEKTGYKRLGTHPNPSKQLTYYRYVLYRNNLKNREFGKEGPQAAHSEQATIALGQGASENAQFEANPTSPKTDSSSCFGITRD